jgi:D-glycero-beta-D-manno-heptose-7-phosphate kinase
MMDSLFKSFENATVLVVGDVMVDCYLNGKVNRISPEAPVPIMNVQNREYRLGGAANVALNLKSLGANPVLCSVIGKDNKGNIVYSLMQKNDLDALGIIPSTDRKTTIKYRVVGNKTQMLRIDDEDDSYLNEKEATQFLTTLNQIIDNQKIDAIILVDYDKGLLSANVIRQIVDLSKKLNIITTVDPKRRNFWNYEGVTLFKPNLQELCDGLRIENSNFSQEEIHQLLKDFAIKQNIDYVMTTLSEKGIAIYDKKEDTFYSQSAFLRNISDVSGAGDTVMSISSLCLIAKLSAKQTARLANLGGGIVCEYAGVVPITHEMLKAEMMKQNGFDNI